MDSQGTALILSQSVSLYLIRILIPAWTLVSSQFGKLCSLFVDLQETSVKDPIHSCENDPRQTPGHLNLRTLDQEWDFKDLSLDLGTLIYYATLGDHRRPYANSGPYATLGDPRRPYATLGYL